MKDKKLLEMTKEIVIAMISSASNIYPEEAQAEHVAEAMQTIYNKLVELNNNNDDN